MSAPLHRGQGNETWRTSQPVPASRRGQTVPYNVNGAPAGGATTASNVTVSPTGGISSTNVQSALSELDTEKQTAGAIPILPPYTVSTLPSASTNARGLIYVSNESGGAVPAFSDGTNWRRVTDRIIVS